MRRTNRGTDTGPGLLAGLFVASVLLVLSPSLPAQNSPHRSHTTTGGTPPGPSLRPEEFFDIRKSCSRIDIALVSRRLAEGKEVASACSVGVEETTCRNLEFDFDSMRLSAGRWRASGERWSLTEVEVEFVDSGRVWEIASISRKSTGVGFRAVEIRDGDGALTVESGEIRGGELRLATLVWRQGRAGPAKMKARRADFSGEQWTFQRLRRPGPIGVGLGEVRTRGGEPTTGLVPPRIATSDGRVAATQRIVFGQPALGASVSVAPTDWYGAGAVVQTPPNRAPFAAHGPPARLLDGEVRWSHSGDGIGWSFLGEFRRGNPYVHAGASVEEQSEPEFWRTARIDRPGTLRRWRSSEAGVSLSGPHHHLQLSAGHWSPVSAGTAPSLYFDRALPGEQLELAMNYGSAQDFGGAFEATQHLYHRNHLRRGAGDIHNTAGLADLSVRLGRRGRANAAAGVTGALGAELGSSPGPGTTTSGFDARGSTQLVGHLEASFTLTGRLGSKTVHRIHPSIAAYRELVGSGPAAFDATPAAGPPGRVADWTAVRGLVDQTFVWPSFRIDLPLGVAADGTYPRGKLLDEPFFFGRVAFSWPSLRISAGALQALEARTPELYGGIGIGEAELRVDWRATTLTDRTVATTHLGAIAEQPVQALRLWQPLASSSPADGLDGQSLFQSLSFNWRIAETWVEVDFFSRGVLARNGVRGAWVYPLEPLGWGLSLDAVYRTTRRSWGISAGLRTRFPRRRGL